MTFSVVVVLSKGLENESRREIFSRCLENLLGQDFPKDAYEIILVDSGSGRDGSEQEKLKRRAEKAGVSLRYLVPGEGNIGPARGRNFGAKDSRPDFETVVFTDDDVLVSPFWLEKLAQVLEANPEAAGVGGVCIPPEEIVSKNVFAAHEEQVYGQYFPGGQNDLSLLREGRLGGFFSRKVLEHPVFSGNIAYRKKVFWEVSGFDETFKPGVYGEDAALKEKILAQGYFLSFVPVINEHWASFNLKSFILQQKGRGAGIVKFRADHGLYEQTKPEILVRVIFSPLSLIYFLVKTKVSPGLSILEFLGYFFRQLGKLEYLAKAEVKRQKSEVGRGRRIKILFLDHTPLVGGAQLALLRHLKYLDQKKFEPTVVVSKGGPLSEKFQRIDDLEVFETGFPRLKVANPLNFVSFLISTVRLLWIFLSRRPALFLANTERAFYISFLPSLILRKPLVLAIRDFEFSKFLLKLLNFGVRHYLCVSEKIVSFYNLPPRKSAVVYVGSDLLERLPRVSPEAVDQVRAASRIRHGGVVLGFVGRLIEWKGPRLLLEAFARILQEDSVSPIYLIIVGEGPQRAELDELIIRRGLASKVYLVGPVTDVELWYKLFDVFVHASVGPEPFATTLVEAALSGLPIVATNTGGTGEFVVDGENGLLVEPTLEGLVGGLRRLLPNPDLRRKLGQAAQARAANEFTEQKITRVCEKIYEDLANDSR